LKKFLFRGFCFVSIGLILLFASNAIYINTNWYKSQDDDEKYFTNLGDLDVINLGTSHGQFAFDYSEIPEIKGENLAKGSQNFYFDSEVLKKYGRSLKEGCVVIIPVSYFSFVSYLEEENQRTLYYKLLDYGSIPNHSPMEYLRYKLLPILFAGFNIKYILKDIGSSQFNLLSGSLDHNDVEIWKEHAAARAERHNLARTENHEFTSEENHQRNVEELEEMIGACNENGLRPVLTTTPFTKYYNDELPQEYYLDFCATINDICQEYGATYLNYSHDPLFTERLEYFADSDHMSPLGARVFTLTILRDLGLVQTSP
jgi:hypothetical protein